MHSNRYVHFANCLKCDEKFQKRHKGSKYCSPGCAAKARPPKPRRGLYRVCPVCSTTYYVPLYRADKTKYCSRSCLAKDQLPQYAAHRFQPLGIPPRKYKQVTRDGKEVREHRHTMEQFVGRRLEQWEHVHHINGDSLDNRIENLVILTNREHPIAEIMERKIKSSSA